MPPREIPKSRLRRADDNFKFFFGGKFFYKFKNEIKN